MQCQAMSQYPTIVDVELIQFSALHAAVFATFPPLRARVSDVLAVNSPLHA